MRVRQLFRRKTIAQILRDSEAAEGMGMRRSLGVRDLTSLGIAAIIGAGIFSTIGMAASYGGPAVSLLFVFTALACSLSALCYAQFAGSIPISGSAYTYAYATFGELIAWIIGWDLIMEYAVGNIAVAISWSDYFTGLMHSIGWHIPEFFSVDFLSASRGHTEVLNLLASGAVFEQLSWPLREAWLAWENAPIIAGVRLIADIPAFLIVVFVTVLVFVGIYETKVAGNIMVLLKLVILLLIIGVGAFFITPENWRPFAPNGFSGVLKGVAGVFFAYIGFDAISTTAEECRNPRRDLPRAMIYALLITTVLYVAISLVLTGMVHYSELAVGDPLAYAFEKIGMSRLSGVIAVSAVVAMASVLLVFQVGQPRIWMSMSRDGLLPPIFSRLHKRFRTPAFATIVTGCLVAIPSLFMNITEVTDLTSIGTLFAFVLVSGGVLLMDRNSLPEKSFKVPYVSSRYSLPLVWMVVAWAVFSFYPQASEELKLEFTGGWEVIRNHIPSWIFAVVAIGLSLLAVVKKLSLIPVLGVLTNLYLMSQLGWTNWMRFAVWLLIGLVLYFLYGYRKSRLNHA